MSWDLVCRPNCHLVQDIILRTTRKGIYASQKDVNSSYWTRFCSKISLWSCIIPDLALKNNSCIIRALSRLYPLHLVQQVNGRPEIILLKEVLDNLIIMITSNSRPRRSPRWGRRCRRGTPPSCGARAWSPWIIIIIMIIIIIIIMIMIIMITIIIIMLVLDHPGQAVRLVRVDLLSATTSWFWHSNISLHKHKKLFSTLPVV